MRIAAGRIAATLCAYVVELRLPGEVVAPATAVIDVGVLAEWRGTGFLRELMTAFIEGAHERGEALAVLNTDEETLYPRFGFGVATWSQRVSIAAGAALRSDAAKVVPRIEPVSDLEAESVLPELFESSAATRLGEVRRTEAWWQEYFEDARRGPFPMEFAVSTTEGRIDGYVAMQLPDRPMADAGLVVSELVAPLPETGRALLTHCIGRTNGLPVRLRSCPTDLGLFAELHDVVLDPKKPQLWLRLIDVAAALVLRRYHGPSRLVFDITDPTAPWNTGRFALDVDANGCAVVEATTQSPSLELGPVELAAVFLARVRFENS